MESISRGQRIRHEKTAFTLGVAVDSRCVLCQSIMDQLLTSSMMEYAVPKADFFPRFEVDRTVTPTDVNPLGVKGAGETGTIASTAAVANAVMDALSPFGIKHLDMPLTPGRIWEALRGRKEA